MAPTQGSTAKLGELSKEFDHPFEGIPPIVENDRLIVFLRRPGALPEFNPIPNLPVDTSDWEPANATGDLRTSTVWIQDGVTYSFLQTRNPGPTHLTTLLMSEVELRRSIESVLLLRGAMDQAVANTDPVERSRQFGALVRSNNEIARGSAIEKLKFGGATEANVLLDLLSDEDLIGWHQDFVGALAGMRVAGIHFAQFLSHETVYWSKVCSTLGPGWWSGVSPDVETTKSHYTRAYALLKAIHELGQSEATAAVRDFAAVWSTCPPLEERENTSQIAEELKLLDANDR